MQSQALRKEASSKLTLFAAISMLLLVLASPVQVWSYMDSSLSSVPVPSYMLPYLKITVVIVMLPALGVMALPVVGMFLLYANARSDRPLKTAGYTILRGYMIAVIVFSSILLIISIPTGSTSYRSFSTFFSVLLELLIAVMAVSALKTAKEVVMTGSTFRRIPDFLPVALITSFCVSAAELVISILANTVPSLVEALPEYRIESAAEYYARVGYAALGLVSSFLFILLCLRGRKVFLQQRAPADEPIE